MFRRDGDDDRFNRDERRENRGFSDRRDFRDRDDRGGFGNREDRGGFGDRREPRDRDDRSSGFGGGGYGGGRREGGYGGGGERRSSFGGGGYGDRREPREPREPREMDESVFSKRLRAGKRRTYFFDVKRTRGDDFFVTLTESTKKLNGFGYERHKMFLYKEDFNRFVESLQEVVNHVKTELMPNYDYDEFARRQEEWEAANREADGGDTGEDGPEEGVERTKISLKKRSSEEPPAPETEDEADPKKSDSDDDMAW